MTKKGKNSENFSRCAYSLIPAKGAALFFDSGLGGLSLLWECVCRGLRGDVLYYGDNAYAPYGGKSEGEILRRVNLALEETQLLQVSRLIIACNTVTAVCLPTIKKAARFPIHGTFPPLVEAARLGGEVFALVTPATKNSTLFKSMCAHVRNKYPRAKIIVHAIDGLAAEIERGYCSPFGIDAIKYLPKGAPTSVVLGCTHYSHVKDVIERFYSCPAFDCSAVAANRLFPHKKPLEIGARPLSTTNPRFGVFFHKTAGDAPLRFCRFCLNKQKIYQTKPLNKYSRLLKKTTVFRVESTRFSSIFFLGTGKVVNKIACEQMFVVKCREKYLKSGHKSQNF